MKPADHNAKHTDNDQGAIEAARSKKSLRTWLKLLKSTKQVEAVIRQKLREEFETTLPRFDVMAALYRFDSGLRMSDLSAALRVSNGNVTGIIERLVSDGAVLRVAVEGDKRAMLVLLTQKGREEFEKLAAAHERWISDVFNVLNATQSAELVSVIDTIQHAMDLKGEHDDML